MNTIDDGGHAFPADASTNTFSRGMSLRDYFAAKALMALDIQAHVAPPAAAILAASAYAIADAMLAARGGQ